MLALCWNYLLDKNFKKSHPFYFCQKWPENQVIYFFGLKAVFCVCVKCFWFYAEINMKSFILSWQIISKLDLFRMISPAKRRGLCTCILWSHLFSFTLILWISKYALDTCVVHEFLEHVLLCVLILWVKFLFQISLNFVFWYSLKNNKKVIFSRKYSS